MLNLSINKNILAPALLLVITLCYWPAINGPFVFDDQVNILENPAVMLHDLSGESLKKAMFSNESGVLKRILPALSFGLNYYQAHGFDNTFYFKITNLTIHLINSLLVFSLILQLASRLFNISAEATNANKVLWSAFFVALLWAVHPLQMSTVMYIVQRMTSMAALFMLLGLNGYVWARNRLVADKPYALLGMLVAIVLGTGLGLLCKENAALLVLYAAVIEFTLYATKPYVKKVVAFYALLLGVPLLAGVYLIFNGRLDLLAGFYTRPFTLEQRLFTELRVLWFYLQMLVYPDIRVMGLYHDDLMLSKSWFEPMTTLWSGIAWSGALISVWWFRCRKPVISFAIAWFLVGHSMESSVLPLEIIYEHRNYLPSLGVICLLVYSLLNLSQRLQAIKNISCSLATLIILSALFSILTWQRAHYWESEETLFRSLAENNPRSPISLYSYAELLNKKKKQLPEAYQYYLKAVALNKDSASLNMQATLSAPINNTPDPLLDNQKLFILLNKRHLIPWDLTVLEDASRCVLGKMPQCADHMQDVRHWLHAAIDNTHLDQNWRRSYVKSVFDIEMLYGLPQEALKTVLQAQAQDDRVFHYYLMKADALQATGQYQEALSIINTAEQLAQKYNPQLLNSVYRLKSRMQSMTNLNMQQ